MPEGGFLVKFDGKKAVRCYAVGFHFDEWGYAINNGKKKKLPRGLKKISVQIERGPLGPKRPIR